jgi:hypothetical protein
LGIIDSVRCVALTALTAVVAAACGVREPFKPESVPRYPAVESLVGRLERAVNAREPGRICALYGEPSVVCRTVWARRLERLRLPVDLRVGSVTFDCAGAARAAFAGTGGYRITTFTFVPETPRWIIDVGIGDRRSSLIVPRYGDCANAEGGAGDERCDRADRRGYEDSSSGRCAVPAD